MWTITKTQSEEAWFDDYLDKVVSSSLPTLPPRTGSIGQGTWEWRIAKPGSYMLDVEGPLVDRVWLYEHIANQLEAFGLQKMAVSWTGYDRAQVQAKALRLIRTNKVMIHDNMPNYISGTVIGDHGTYQPDIQRDPTKPPRSQDSLISGHCDCDWGQYMNTPRTRSWKPYQNAPCSHLMALWWLAQAMPVDTGDPNNPHADLLQKGQGDMGQFKPLFQDRLRNFAPNMPGANIPGLSPRPDMQLPQQQVFSPDEAEGFSAPGPEAALPQAPPEPVMVDPNGSVPGKKVPTPSNPIQYPGGTFSSLRQSDNRSFNEGDMVQLLNDDYGTGVGDAGYAGVGQQMLIPKGTVGEVRGVHAPTGMVEVFYNQGPFLQKGRQQAMGATAWHFPSDLQRRPDLPGSSPMIRRT